MKNILIPTLYEADTNRALKIADDFQYGSKDIVLLSISAISDSISDLLFLSSTDHIDTEKRDAVLKFWNELNKNASSTSQLKIHHRYGVSRPLLQSMITRLGIGTIIVPQSFKQSKQYVHQFALRLFHQSGCPMMFLPDNDVSPKGIQRALYIDEPQAVPENIVQQYSFHVIHKSMIKEQESVKSIVDRMKIDLIVKGKRNPDENLLHDHDLAEIGLPILTI